ncbi:SSU ribosomal protein S11p (S14e) [Coxiella-like endosymbiont]|uniref:30S ribosomal protein S11 n=1 Tax=Coxiella endosymbiont of Rhipicephalus microplus TaxID=1656186 RepID=UPI000C80E624|nr:30S ribosomal protein S11 [Coxiella endosymbiont of Rhipicephalus microplus]PMB54807.1 SSU ribosomal protein S11p (S14e) [Coxiella-like endosymbiont]
MAKRRYQKVTQGIAHINATFNNTKICISDLQGNVLYFKSAGGSGFKGSRKGTPYGAQLAAERVAERAIQDFGMETVSVCVKGPGAGRDSAIRGLRSAGLKIVSLEDRTALPHNGCRPRKKRRV